MLPTINEKSERALERWQKLRKSLNRAVSAMRPVRKGRFTIEPYSSPEKYTKRPKILKSGKFGRFTVERSGRVKVETQSLEKKRNKIQKAVNAVKYATRSKYQNALNNLKSRHKIEMNSMEKRHQKNENNLYNKHFKNSNKKIAQLLQALNNINRQLQA